MDEAIIMVRFRPIFSAKGKAMSAPKKQPACFVRTRGAQMVLQGLPTWKVDTMFP